VGYEPDSVHGTVHTAAFNHIKGTQVGKALKVENPYTAFHVYAVEWFETHINFFIDDKLYFTFKNNKKGVEEWPFDQNFHLLLNVAVGGNWGGKNGIDDTIFPTVMKVDYVRVFQK
jgi:beta-glucanase (GH16 family)